MSQFTLEFLPHFAGAIKREADFSLYEVKWNTYGRWGLFECQINLPIDVPFTRSANSSGSTSTLLSDLEFSDSWGNWTNKRLTLSDKYNGQILSEIPNGVFTSPSEWFLLRLILAFSKEDRIAISNMFHFRFSNHISKELIQTFKSDDAISSILTKYRKHFF